MMASVMQYFSVFMIGVITSIFSSTTPQRQVARFDLNNNLLNIGPGTPLTRARKAQLLLAGCHQEMGLTSSRSPLTRAKKALLMDT
jgi:hypothetical protein